LSSQVIIRIGDRTISSHGPIDEIPSWSKPGFKGIVRSAETAYFLAAHTESAGQKHVQVFAYTAFDDTAVATLVPRIARVRLFRFRDFAGESIGEPDINARSARSALDSARIDGALSFDFAFGGFPLPRVRDLESGQND